MDEYWLSQFRATLARFAERQRPGFLPVSVKVRVLGGCFHREHSKEAYRLIDDHVAKADFSDVGYKIEEHETGPEVLVWAALATAGLVLAKSVIELITAMIKARSEGTKKGDHPSEPVELIVRGFGADGKYFEETILRVKNGEEVSAALVERALAAKAIQTGNSATDTRMSLDEAAKRFPIAGIEAPMLAKQPEAFEACMLFLQPVEKTKQQNTRRHSGGLKHDVERGTRASYNGYVYEGTFILAALASGFQMRAIGKMRATFNISERSLKKRIKALSE